MSTTKQKNRKRMQNNQQGFVLILALVLLAVMTLIGVSSMNSANMELKATANARQHQLAFNAVQSLLEYTLSKGALTTAGVLIDYQTTDTALQQLVEHPALSNNSQASVGYAGCSSVVGSSLEAGRSFSFNFYSVAANGTNSTGTSSSQVNQGVRYPSASCVGL